MLRRDHIKQINFTFELQITVYSKKCNLFLIQIIITQQDQELTGQIMNYYSQIHT